jgi:peptide/nickel transport system permease protein
VWACNLLADAIRDVSGEAGRALIDARLVRARRPRRAVPTDGGAR